MPLFSPLASRNILYASIGISVFSVYKHTEISIRELFPMLNDFLGPKEALTFSTKSSLLELSASWITMAILQAKWAKYGVNGTFDQVLLGWYALHNFLTGLGYLSKGWYLPLLPTWGIPGLVLLSQL